MHYLSKESQKISKNYELFNPPKNIQIGSLVGLLDPNPSDLHRNKPSKSK